MKIARLTAVVLFLSLTISVSGGPVASLLQLVGTIPLDGVEGRLDHMAVDVEGQRLFVAALGNDTVEVLDAHSNSRLMTLTGLRHPQGVLFVPDFHTLYVTSAEGRACDLYDGRTLAHKDTLLFPDDDLDNIRYDPAGRKVYVGYGRGALGEIDAAAEKRVADIPLDAHPESFQLEKAGKRIFVNVPNKNISVVDRDSVTVVARWSLAPLYALANFPMALDEPDHRLFSVFRSPPELLVLDTDTGRRIAKVPVVGDADDVFYDARRGRVYVSGGKGFLSIVEQKDADHYGFLTSIKTAEGARTSIFVPAWDRLYVGVPHRGNQKAEIRIYKATP